ncbi:energy-coupling factor ABC transporter ATP-binding protein [Vagococcus entomophilus]|uniref:Energy-coupling factor transporter ATPase n=1 Tax=Vagococcus entomophilus TaxID=1160095 RepID=A0A430AF48_9ENTE|nr:energy-coupling factor ABC transporter ATP-binding protein [Vagococcus entomophilus]RSU06226.1 energy-coupling factor transporter ATPase [Vagococcus entomophilus]
MESIIELKNIDYHYRQEEEAEPVLALNDISFKIKRGDWIAVIGHNGSGKSTLAKIIDGLLVPTRGEVWIDGQLLTEESVWEARKRIGMVFQNPDNQFVGATVEDDVAFGLENQGIKRDIMVERVQNALKRVRMDEFMDREPSRLSGGQKQRVAIAGVVALRPDVIILDEATSMLDPEGRQEVVETIKQIKEEENLTVISITHDIDEAANANRILLMKQGQLLKEGTPKEIFAYGRELIDMGLDLPFSEKLKIALVAKGYQVPEDYTTEEGMVDWLWTFNSKK